MGLEEACVDELGEVASIVIQFLESTQLGEEQQDPSEHEDDTAYRGHGKLVLGVGEPVVE